MTDNERILCEEEEQEKTSKALDEIILILQKYKLRVQDLVLLYGNLGYSIGASIEGLKNTEGPSIDELQKNFYEKPTVGIAMMLQGMLTTTWYDDVIKSNKEKEE
jgi:hypothetical protein